MDELDYDIEDKTARVGELSFKLENGEFYRLSLTLVHADAEEVKDRIVDLLQEHGFSLKHPRKYRRPHL